MWIAIVGVFVLVTVLFGQSPHRDGSTHPKPAVAEVAEPVEPGLVPHADGAPPIYNKD
jgi:hypothetical protein